MSAPHTAQIPAPEESPWLTREEAAAYLRIAPRSFDRYVRDGEVNRFYLNKSPRFRRSEIEALIVIDDKPIGHRMPAQLVRATEASLQSRGHLAAEYQQDAPQVGVLIQNALDG